MNYVKYIFAIIIVAGFGCKQSGKEQVYLKGVITEGNDRVKIIRIVDGKKQEISTFDTLMKDDEIKLIPGNRASIDFQGKVKLELKRNANLILKKLDTNAVEFKLESGKMRLVVPPPNDTIRVDIYTPTVITSIRGTELNFELDSSGRTIVWMESGSADVALLKDQATKVTISGKQMVVAESNKLSTPREFTESDDKLIKLANGLSGMVWLEPDFTQWDNKKLTFSMIGKLFDDSNPTMITPSFVANFKRLTDVIYSETNYTFRIMGYDKLNGEEQARQVYLKLIEVGIPAERLSWGVGSLPANAPIQIEVEYIQ